MTLGTEVGLGPGHIALHGDPAPLLKKGAEPPPIFRPMSIVAKRLYVSGYHLVRTEVGLSLGNIVLDGNPASLP